MAAILTTWLVLAILFIGFGASLQRFVGISPRSLFASFWLGFGSVLTFLQIWHLFFPITSVCVGVLAVLGGACLLWNWRNLRDIVRDWRGQPWWYCAGVLFVALWLANRALGPVGLFDAGLYHLPAIRWAMAYPVVPGLANLHIRLGFFSSYFLYLALLEAIPYDIPSNALGHGLLFAITLAQLGMSVPRLVQTRRGQPLAFREGLALVLLFFTLFEAFRYTATSSPDSIVFILGVIISWYLAGLVFPEPNPNRSLPATVALITFLAAIGVSVKLSFIALAGMTSLIALAFVLAPALSGARQRSSGRSLLAALLLCTAPPALVLLLMAGHGIILSGYPLFPNTVGGLPFDWQAPRQAAINISNVIQSWARLPKAPPAEVLANWNWLRPWLTSMMSGHLNWVEIFIPWLVFLGGLPLLVALRKRPTALDLRRLLLVLIPAVCAALFWFFAAPSERFAGASLGLLAAITAAALIRLLPARWQKSVGFSIFYSSIALIIGYWLWWGAPIYAGPPAGYDTLPRDALVVSVTNSGLQLDVPKGRGQCWDAPLLCTPHPDPRIRLRRANDLRYGFTVAPP